MQNGKLFGFMYTVTCLLLTFCDTHFSGNDLPVGFSYVAVELNMPEPSLPLSTAMLCLFNRDRLIANR